MIKGLKPYYQDDSGALYCGDCLQILPLIPDGVGYEIPIVHPTQKPIELMRWCVEMVTKPNDLILDPYCGSGSTLVAAKQLGRKYIGIEISEKYCAIAADRLRQEQLPLNF